MKALWTEKYRPRKIDDYVWLDDTLRRQADGWLVDRVLPHLLFSGDPGVGKTSLAYLLLDELQIPSEDRLFIAASRERKVDNICDRIGNFVNSWAFGETGMKYVILDEADAITPLAQKTLRTDMEVYSGQCRIICTANYPERIIPALHSRFQSFHFDALPRDDFMLRLGQIMEDEAISTSDEQNIEALISIVDSSYPDLRKCIGLLQQGCVTEDGVNRLLPPRKADTTLVKDFLIEAARLINANRLLDARKLIVAKARQEDYPDIYRWLAHNLELWGSRETQQDEALLVIRKALVHHSMIADPEMNLSACLVELKMIRTENE